MEVDQNDTIRRGEYRELEFLIDGQAGATTASWFMAPQRESTPAEHVLDLSTGAGGVTLTIQGDDLLVTVTMTGEQSEAIEPGDYHHELWLEDVLDRPVPVAEGVITILDSLRN